MKKNVLLIAAAAVTVALASCSGGENNKEVTTDSENVEMSDAPAEAASWMVDADNSSIRWEGGTAGAQVYSHFGTINISEGKLMSEGNEITGGMFVVDMTSINPQDENYSEENPSSKLVGHLTTGDFFAVEEHPSATFEITNFDAESNTISGNLTIRGNTNEESIEVSEMEMMEDGSMMAKGRLVFDRQKYDVAWEHYLQDVVLSDDITLDITLSAKKA